MRKVLLLVDEDEVEAGIEYEGLWLRPSYLQEAKQEAQEHIDKLLEEARADAVNKIIDILREDICLDCYKDCRDCRLSNANLSKSI